VELFGPNTAEFEADKGRIMAKLIVRNTKVGGAVPAGRNVDGPCTEPRYDLVS
jgi:hypothetical protein